MADLPILFSAPMVRAILREIKQPGTGKTQTRRVLNPQPPADMGLVGIYAPKLTAVFGYETPDSDFRIPLRYMPGDRLWVREAWRAQQHFDGQSPAAICAEFEAEYGAASCPAFYEADEKCDCHSVDLWQQSPPGRLRASMHMPRCASRLTLIVTDVRVQRLQEISEADAIAEGLEHDIDGDVDGDGRWITIESWRGADILPWLRDPVDAYADLWDQLNDARGFGWDANPWVAAYTFRPIFGNIDQVRP